MRNPKPSEAAMRRERFGLDRPLESAPPPPLEARIEEIAGFEFEAPSLRTSRPRFGPRFGSGIAMIAAAAMLVVAVVCVAVFLPRALGN
jgi:anti-sigma-K factor RskA